MDGARIQVTGQDEALEALQGYVERASNPRGMFDNIGARLVVSTQRRFERKQGPDGSPWPPAIRELLGDGRPTLRVSGILVQSLTHNATESGVEVGTNVLYAAIHQLGGTITAKTSKGLRFKVGGQWATKQQVTIPARPFLGIDEDDETEILAIARDWIADDEAGTGAAP
ncbi:MAG: phage virion morphogenesis protein [Gammaproteobacteria bacterium]